MKSVKPAPNNTAVLQLALTAHRQGRFDDAKAGYMQILRSDDRHVDALHLLGLVHLHRGDLVEAERLIRKALALRESAIFWGNLGNLLKNSHRLAEAEAAYRRALELKPDYVEAHYNLGILLKDSHRTVEAEAAYRRALELKPDHVDTYNNLGLLLKDSHRLAEAEAAYRRALELKPDHVDTHYNLGILLKDSHRLAEAETAYRRALELKPDYIDAHNNLANLLKNSHRLAEAEAAYRRALELKPDYVEAQNNLGVLLYESKCMPEAEAAYRRALAFKPDYAEARFSLSILLLALQRYDEAWPLHESRYAPERKEVNVNVPSLSYPQWQGESLLGKSLVIWPEQGFGDYIQFVRYASLLKARGVSRLTLVCSPPLSVLLATVEGVDAVVTDMEQLPPHDYWSFLMSLPLYCATTADNIPVAPMPYVHALPSRVAQWCERLPATGLKVGLVWKGSSGHKNDSNRSLPGLASLLPLWSVPGVTFISLQKGQGEDEASQPPTGQPIAALGAQMQDFADSAAIVSQLDLVICVDTAIAHVAGALGKPCWVLLPAMGTDWRWLLDRTDSPWYPSVRLFRQTNLEDWSETVDEVASALKTWAIVQS
jgi:tetratricopeptide (TPR) repeat protein